jgi:light-harvesting complex 1 beta chain
MATEYERRSTLSGLSEGEAREFNRIFVLSFVIFTGIAVVAHILAYVWRPWGGDYHTAMLLDGIVRHATLALTSVG